MAVTVGVPLASAGKWFGAPVFGTHVLLLTGGAPPDTAATGADLASLEIATGGGYTRAVGVDTPALTIRTSTSPRLVEADAGSDRFGGGVALSVSFRTAVVVSDITDGIVTWVDYGATQTLTSSVLQIAVTASTVISGSYPLASYAQ